MNSFDIQRAERILTLAASFHLGTPLCISKARKRSNWMSVHKIIKSRFSNLPDEFKILDDNYSDIANFPLGSPILLSANNFFKIFDLEKILLKNKYINSEDEKYFTHEIWIFPTGVVLVIVRIYFNYKSSVTVENLDVLIQNHYADFSKVFLIVAKIVYDTLNEIDPHYDFCHSKDIVQKRLPFDVLEKIKNEKVNATIEQHKLMQGDLELSHILDDVYYVDYRKIDDHLSIDVDYFKTVLKTNPDEYFQYHLMILISFASFWALIWINRYLNERIQKTQNAIFDFSRMSTSVILELKLIRLFTHQFLNESSPINIRLTREYMACIEECWTQFRMTKISDSIKEQLVTLAEILDWFDGIFKEIRNYKIGIIGILFTLLSFLAVASDLTDLFYSATIDAAKITYVLGGGAFGVLLTLMIIFIPFQNWFPRLRSRKKFLKSDK